MNLDDAQRKKIGEWITQGMKLSEIQSRLNSELGLRLTYMEVRLLVDDLRLTPKDTEPAKVAASPLSGTAMPANKDLRNQGPTPAPANGVSVSVDQITRAGAVVSGKVTFSDGNKADWYVDQMGRLGLAAQQPGYRPPAADMPQFQAALDNELAKLGF